MAQNWDQVERAGNEHPDVAVVAFAVAGLQMLNLGQADRALADLGWVWRSGQDPGAHPFAQKYLTVRFVLPIAPGVDADLPFSRDAVGFALAELHQERGELDVAIQIVQSMPLNLHAAVSLGELYCEAGRWADVVTLTNGIENQDDGSALLCVFRGVALREQGHLDASREALKEALRSKARDAGIRRKAWFERAQAYAASNKKGMARKDLERILAEDARYPGVQEALAALDA